MENIEATLVNVCRALTDPVATSQLSQQQEQQWAGQLHVISALVSISDIFPLNSPLANCVSPTHQPVTIITSQNSLLPLLRPQQLLLHLLQRPLILSVFHILIQRTLSHHQKSVVTILRVTVNSAPVAQIKRDIVLSHILPYPVDLLKVPVDIV